MPASYKEGVQNKLDSERLIADILDVLQLNFNLTDAQIRRSYEFHKNQKRLQKYLEKQMLTNKKQSS